MPSPNRNGPRDTATPGWPSKTCVPAVPIGRRVHFGQRRATEQFAAASRAQGHDIPDVIIDGEVLEAEPPTRLVTTFRMLMDPELAREPFTRITYEIKEGTSGVCSLTLTHELEGAPLLALLLGGAFADQGAGGGHAWVLSDLKTLLETGRSFAA